MMDEDAGGTPALQVGRLTPAMRRWQERLDGGYSIRPFIKRSTYRGTVWGWGLHNPNGDFVQNVPRDTVQKLRRLGIWPRAGVDGHGRTGESG